jgi:hypothetical protein
MKALVPDPRLAYRARIQDEKEGSLTTTKPPSTSSTNLDGVLWRENRI